MNVWATRDLDGVPANEVCLTTIPSGGGLPILFASFNVPGLSNAVANGWTRSEDGGATWKSKSDMTTPLPKIRRAGTTAVHQSSIGDTWVTAVGPDKLVAMTSVVAVPGSPLPIPTDVGLWISKDGGLTFPNELSMRVSELGSTGVDGPKVAADPSGTALWVWWYSSPGQGVNKNWL